MREEMKLSFFPRNAVLPLIARSALPSRVRTHLISRSDDHMLLWALLEHEDILFRFRPSIRAEKICVSLHAKRLAIVDSSPKLLAERLAGEEELKVACIRILSTHLSICFLNLTVSTTSLAANLMNSEVVRKDCFGKRQNGFE